MERVTFFRRSFWMTVIAFALFTAAYGPAETLDKVLGFGVVVVSVVLVAYRGFIIEVMSYEETMPDPNKSDQTVKTGKVIRADDDITERLVLVVALLTVLWSLFKLQGNTQVYVITWAALASIAAVAARRAADTSERDVSVTQMSVFYLVPIIVTVALFTAYLSGLSAWFVIGAGLLCVAWQIYYGRAIDRIEREAPGNVVRLKPVQSA